MAPKMADAAAARIRLHVPQAKLVVVLRDPVERLRSEYRYNRQRGWDQRDLTSAVAAPENPYVGKSLYFRCLLPYLERFECKQIVVVRTEELHDPDGAWAALLDFLALEQVPAPVERHLETDTLPQMRPINGFLERRYPRAVIGRLPAPLRKAGQWLATDRDPLASRRRRADSEAALPDAVLDLLRKDASMLHDALGWRQPAWASVS